MSKLVIVLTGGIASGKTQVSDTFKDLGSTVVDADLVARQVVAKDTTGWQSVFERFGDEVMQPDGELNRDILRNIVFNDPRALKDLNDITHPLISQTIKSHIEQTSQGIVLVVIPLLTKDNQYPYFERILVIDVCPKVQNKRLQQRDGIDWKLADKMMASQMTRDQRLLLADDIIVNNRSLHDLKRSAELMHGYYQSLLA
ncbi:dephospho-CoA kinase [Marinicella gelatinilytica]|uniref:dephospho-CoA kinase n=1 Tax=Marinicella gelatinilytica TaxID=2996017 RepID=UPI002260A9E0|nr:dephospho-CoA kinase [Marinicella gelatinilytica]MCX7544676.1 dephospho-CoA kinase [Marinicella gelatinilytica]